MKFLTLLFALAFLHNAGAQTFSVSGPSTQWVPMVGDYDYFSDQQTGQAAGDIVGLGLNYGFFIMLNDNGPLSRTDGTFGFRLRLNGPDSNSTPSTFTRVAWLGIDANTDDTIDVFIGVNNSGSSSIIGVFAPGTGLNNSPSTTTVSSTASSSNPTNSQNFNYRPVNYLNDGGTTNDLNPGNKPEPDYYVSAMVNFADIVSYLAGVGINIDDTSPLRFVPSTATQANSLNQDIGGVEGGLSSTALWSQTGAYTPLVSANGAPIPVPEPTLLPLLLLGSAALLARRRRCAA